MYVAPTVAASIIAGKTMSATLDGSAAPSASVSPQDAARVGAPIFKNDSAVSSNTTDATPNTELTDHRPSRVGEHMPEENPLRRRPERARPRHRSRKISGRIRTGWESATIGSAAG